MAKIGGAFDSHSSGAHDDFEKRCSSVMEASTVAIVGGIRSLDGAFCDRSAGCVVMVEWRRKVVRKASS